MEGFAKSKNIIPETQHGFMAYKSVATALVKSWDDYTKAIDNREWVYIIYLDIKSAFDTSIMNLSCTN